MTGFEQIMLFWVVPSLATILILTFAQRRMYDIPFDQGMFVTDTIDSAIMMIAFPVPLIICMVMLIGYILVTIKHKLDQGLRKLPLEKLKFLIKER